MNGKISSVYLPSRINRYLVTVVFVAFIEMAFFGFYGYLKHSNYLTSINDLGQFDQAVWGFLKGAPFLNTILFDIEVNWLCGRFSPIIALFVPLYAILPTANWLIFVQAIALPLAAIPLFYIAKKIFNSEFVACLWAVIYMCNPFILNAASWDFHEISLAVPLIAIGFYALEYKKFKVLAVSCLFILMCKEHFGLLVIGFGLLWGIKHREFKPALLLILVGVSFFALIVGVLMPMLNPTGELLMMSTGKGQLSRYGWLGSSAGEIFLRIMSDPVDISTTILVTMDGWVYLFVLALPFLFLPIFEIWALLPGLADLSVNLLSSNPMPRNIYAYHSAPLIPIFMYSAMSGLHRCSKYRIKKLIPAIVVSCLFLSILMGYFLSSFYPLPGVLNSWAPEKIIPYDDPVLVEVKELAGTHSVTVQANVGAHFSQRMEVHPFPQKIGQTDMIILNLDSPTTLKRGDNPGLVRTLAHHLQMNPQLYLESVEELLNDKRYGVVLWKTPWLVLEKNALSANDVKNIKLRLQDLALEWK